MVETAFKHNEVSDVAVANSSEQAAKTFRESINMKDYSKIAMKASDKVCPALTIESDSEIGGQSTSQSEPSEAKKWLDSQNEKALNEALPKGDGDLSQAQKDIANKSIALVQDILDKRKAGDFVGIHDDVRKLQDLFGGSKESKNFRQTSEFFQEIESSIDAQLRKMGARIVTSDVTGQTYLGFADSLTAKDPHYKPLFSLGRGPDCSKMPEKF